MDQHLLVIRADASSIKGMIDGLRDRGYTVVTISNFEMAVDPALAENFDLIIVEHSQNRIGALEIAPSSGSGMLKRPSLCLRIRIRPSTGLLFSRRAGVTIC